MGESEAWTWGMRHGQCMPCQRGQGNTAGRSVEAEMQGGWEEGGWTGSTESVGRSQLLIRENQGNIPQSEGF